MNENGACCDPMGTGCTNQITPGFSLPSSPNRRAPTPCQKCRRKRYEKERADAGRPPVDTHPNRAPGRARRRRTA